MIQTAGNEEEDDDDDEEVGGTRRQGLVAAGLLMAEGACILMAMVAGTVVSSMAVCGGWQGEAADKSHEE
jgi:hypothetical protein